MTQQDQLNADVQAISDALNGIADEITGLKAQIVAQVPDNVDVELDLSGLDAVAQKAKALIPDVTGAVDTAGAPSDESVTSAVPGDATAPTTTPDVPASTETPTVEQTDGTNPAPDLAV